MRVVLDSNVVVSAMLSPHTPPAQVLRAVLQGEIVLLHDPRILAEYREVLLRPKFGFDPDDVRTLVETMEWIGETVFVRRLPVELPDPDDLQFLEVAAEGRADALVTGNARHYRPAQGRHTIEVVTPRELPGRLPDAIP